ncbi:MAG: beta-galactosidase GalA [Acidobacteriota bacterium]
MPSFSRRDLLCSGLTLSASSLLSRSAWARTAALLAARQEASATALPALAPRERLLFDFGWRFQFGNSNDPAKDLGFGSGQEDFAKTGTFKFAKPGYDDSKWRALNLPHDWAVELPFVWDEKLKSHGYKPLGRRYPDTSVGWYRREFDIPASDTGRRITVEFDGAFRDVLLFVNGCFIGRSNNGYVPFHFDISDFLHYGGRNCIVARVDTTFGDGWFYEGAGIYRHVWLRKTDPLYLVDGESYVRSTMNGETATLSLATVARNEGTAPTSALVRWKILDAAGNTVARVETPAQQIDRDGTATFKAEAQLPHPALWSPDQPHIYTAVVAVATEGTTRDAEQVSFGVRTARFDAEKGFFLNGKPMKIQGTCNHQDHAGVGAAVPDALQAYRLAVLKEMGSNAVRTSHNMPTPEWVDACDRMGMMMMCETRQMSSSPEGLAQLESMIKRYRNSPSIILWSIGNEEGLLQDKMAEEGARIAATMVERCHELDPTRPVSAAVNGDNRKGVSDALDVIGFNYNLKFPDAFHQEHPNRPVFGSETASALSTRGEYSTDPLRNTVSAYDVNLPYWGESAEAWWNFYATRAWAAGGFAWTGFDYRGEPTPYGWPSISSQYGIVDTCGFPKDSFFYYKAWWGKEPVLHLFPHWNFEGREGEEIPVWVYSNLDEAELLLNGKSLGRQKVPHLGHAQWKVRYEAGVLEAHGYQDGKMLLTDRRETTGAATALHLSADRAEINADGEDVAVIRVEALDGQGRPVPTADELVSFKVTGPGELIGVGNGDPNCHESDKGAKRSLFNGLAQAIVQAGKQPGQIVVEAAAASPGTRVATARLTITARPARPRPAVPGSEQRR